MRLIKLSLLFIVLVIISCSEKAKKNKKNEIKQLSYDKINVKSTIIFNNTFQKQIFSNGKIEALNKAELRFKTSERINSIMFKNGQRVNKEQTIAVLDNAILNNQLNKAEIELDLAKSKLEEEKINFGLNGPQNKTIEPHILKKLKIKSGFLEAENALENAQLLYNQTFLKSPFAGVIANIKSKTGNYITVSDVFCTLIGKEQLEVVFYVLENELFFIEKNQQVWINSFVDSNTKYKGLITEINPVVDENGLVQIKAQIHNPDEMLFDGTHVKVIINKTLNNVLVIPKEALVLRSNKEVVFTIKNGLAKWNYVEIIDENSYSYAIKQGMKLGDTIIISGNMNLSHDAKVIDTFVPQSEL